ncbi:MAG: 4-alpha-glucanotransferase [Acidobacteriota bacterium]
MTVPSALERLAEASGILPAYWDIAGREHRIAPDTRLALLRALGVEASDDASAERHLADIAEQDAEHLAPPCTVIRAGASAELRAGAEAQTAVVVLEDGSIVDLAVSGRTLAIPATLPIGHHTVRVHGSGRDAVGPLIVAPPSCPRAADVLGRRKVFGLTGSLYTVRSRDDLGAGDLGDLRRLLGFCRRIGGAFVGVNPLHALANHGDEISPYRPVSRLYKNVLYLDVRAIPELETSEDARALLSRSADAGDVARLSEARHVDYERVMALKLPILRMLFDAFVRDHLRTGSARAGAYRAWVEGEGEPLHRFGAYLALSERLGTSNWRRWPAALRDSRSREVRDATATEEGAIAWHSWLQFELDRQLASAAGEARRLGLPIGVYQDLALGSAPDACDTWAFPGTFCEGVSLGAPPDPLGELGQDWGLPPMHPGRLREDGYRFFILLLRAALRHSGALRIDHVMGLYRQFWVPEGRPGSEGAYVRFPADDLFGILALESTRAGALVVGEDLGTVPAEVPVLMRRHGLLGSRILYFEQDPGPRFRPPASYPEDALVTANTHDLPTLEGYWTMGDHALRRKLGIFQTDAELATALASREVERRALLAAISAASIAVDPDDGPARRGAIHAVLCKTNAALVGLSLEDLAGEPEPVNVPGTTLDRYPCWSRRLPLSLEELETDPGVKRSIEGAERERGLPPGEPAPREP